MTELASFHDKLFPPDVSFGATGGPERRNEIVLMSSGRERRNLRGAHSRRTYDAGTGVRSIQHIYDVLAFFEARRGSFHAFRFRDPFDNRSCRPEEVPADNYNYPRKLVGKPGFTAGTCLRKESSRESLPCCSSSSTAIAVNSLDIDAMLKSESGVSFFFSSIEA